ncbi:hypothetical protein OUZ56_023184 [Daphnia magna]|uniref:Uncharacterized protein n=1 Tax=Daphnia magna TaxID=35525 RepID=A0ABR0AYJ6_9CRUS|nr:hypothetical protein OUZ56_023184 [Daphnia magna]
MICGIASIGIQIAAITIFLAKFGYYYITFTSNVVGYGIWGGALNLIAGCLGIALTYAFTAHAYGYLNIQHVTHGYDWNGH